MPLLGYAPYSSLAPSLTQTSFLELSSDVSTTSASFVDLISITIYTYGGTCLVTFSVSGEDSANNRNLYFQLVMDGTPIKWTQFRTPNTQNSACLTATVIPAEGSHTFLIQWRVSANTGQIRPVTVNEEHAALLIEEVAR